jgi:hypothetical protein
VQAQGEDVQAQGEDVQAQGEDVGRNRRMTETRNSTLTFRQIRTSHLYVLDHARTICRY